MQKLQDSVFTIIKTTNLSPAVFSFLQPSDEFGDKTPLGGILKDTKYGWLALGPKFCVVDLRTGLKVAARTFGASLSNNTTVTCVVELPKPLTENSQQLIVSLQCDDIGMICVLHINGSQILRCIQTDVVVTELAICDRIPDGPFTCFDGLVMAGTKRGEIFVFDLNRASLIQALKDISQGYEHVVQNEANPTSLSFLPLNAMQRLEEQRELALENCHHLAILLNENSMVEGQYIFRNPDGTVRMKAKRDHIRVTVLKYIPQLGSMAVGFNFGAFQIWNLMTLDLEFTSQVNVECLPVTHFGFQEPCDDPRAFCYLWVIFSVIDRYEDEEFPLAVMYSLTYQGKRMLSDTKCLYQDFSTATIRFQVELGTLEEGVLLGGKCISCHSYSIKSTLGDDGEDSMLNICQLVWECWGEDTNSPMQYGMLLFDLDQWYKDQMPATYPLESSPFMSATWCTELAARGSVTLHARLDPTSVCSYSHATRLEEHFYPNSLQYDCICLNTSEALSLRTVGIQRQIVGALEEAGGAALLHPARLHAAAARAGLAPHCSPRARADPEDQRRYLLSVALEARLSRFLKRCAHDWATGSHSGVGCTLPFLVDWAWKRAVELKENAKELTAPLFISSALPDRNVVRCLEHCVQQLTQLTDLMDAILTKCCNLVVPDALSEMEERHIGIGCVSLYFQVVQWLLRVGLLPERGDGYQSMPYPGNHLQDMYNKRRMKLNRLQDTSNISNTEENAANKSCSLLYIDQLIENEFGGERVHDLWIKGGSECHGLYPPPSLYSLLRLYLLPDIAEEHKHSLVLYLLVDYSMVYDDGRYEAVIRRLMQFPTMFGLSNTAIKATQAFWHLDHRDFDFALDQLQCLTGNTLHEWQHNVVLSSLLAQKKTQAALQYLHVRKPAPIQNIKDGNAVLNYSNRLSDHDKLEDWHSCCNLYLARGLVFEALDVVRMCAQLAPSVADKAHVLTFFFKGCRNTGNLSKVLQVSLLPFEEEVFIKYLENCNESQTSDLLIMYYLQQARYLEAERYNNKIKQSKPQRNKELSTSVESLFEVADREGARDALVDVVCAALPKIAATVAHCALDWNHMHSHVNAPQPMSVFVQAKSPKNTFTYKSSFIQDTIENASETWMNKPKMRKGLKRALNIEETPFICTPKLLRSRSVFTDQLQSESTPPKRARLNLTGTPKTPKMSFRVSDKLSSQMEQLLDMPEAQSPVNRYQQRAETPHSILKIRKNEREEAPSPVDSRYLGDSDDELLETASSHTHYSDSTNKHLRFTIPTASESGSTPSPVPATSPLGRVLSQLGEKETLSTLVREKETDVSTESFMTTVSHAINENNPLESPPKKQATETNVQSRRSYKDTVRARLSISANSSLSEDPNTSMESIADIPITLINPRYSGERRKTSLREEEMLTSDSNLEQTSYSAQDIERNLEQSSYSITDIASKESYVKDDTKRVPRITIQDTFGEGKREEISSVDDNREERLEVPRTPKGRRGIRSIGGESTPLINRSRSGTPERQDSPIATPMRVSRMSRSRSKTPELSPRSSPLAPIPEQPKQEVESESHQEKTTLRVPRQNLRSKSRTPERMVSESPKLEVITESPTKTANADSSSSSSRRSLRSKSRTPERTVSESPKLEVITESPAKSSSTDSSSSPSRRSLRSRSRTPEVEIVAEPIKSSPRTLRSRSKTPEKLMSPKKEHSVRTKKSLSRIVLEANTFAKTKQTLETLETEITESRKESIECTPMKPTKQVPSLMDVTLSPIVNKSVLQSSDDSALKDDKSDSHDTSELGLKTLPAFTTLQETYYEKSVLRSYQSSIADTSDINEKEKDIQIAKTADSNLKPLPAFTTFNETDFNKSVLHSYESSVAETSQNPELQTPQKEKLVELPKPFAAFASMIETDFERSVLHSHQSSVAESPETSNANASSLITNDSDVEMKGDQDRAERKEKEQIVEIEREIYEIEDMSNGSARSEDTDESSDDETSSEESEESDFSEEPSAPDSEEDDKNEVISIVDDSEVELETSDIDSDSNPLQIVEIEEKVPTAESNQPESKFVENTPDPLEKSDEPERTGKIIAKTKPEEERDPQKEALSSEQLDRNKLGIGQKPSVSDASKHGLPAFSEILTYQNEPELSEIEPSVSTDPLNQAQVSLMTDDNSGLESDQSLSLNYSDEKIEDVNEKPKVEEAPTNVPMKTVVEEVSSKPEAKIEEPKLVPESMDVVDTTDSGTELIENVPSKATNKSETDAKSRDNKKAKLQESDKTDVTEKADSENSNDAKTDQKKMESAKEIEKSSHPEDEKSTEPEKPASRTRKRVKSATKETESKIEKAVPRDLDEPKTPVTRKRANSNASAKSKETETPKDVIKEPEGKQVSKIQNIEEPKTPATRKRTKSNASKPEENTPEEKTPSRRPKTPTSAEARKIITRRVSREMAGKLDESNQSLDDSVSLTPKRRATRSKSKNIDDNESIASESSMVSTDSKVSKEADRKPGRKGRKSVVATKPDLSVIPEVITEESKEYTIAEYSGGRRMTRGQRAMLSSWLNSDRGSGSRSSLASEPDAPPAPFDVQPIDRISLLNKTDFEGPPDADEFQVDNSPDSIASDASKMKRSRLGRAVSEARAMPKAAKIGRRSASIDVVESSEIVSPALSVGSPARGRRASFNRACEALHTPKGRRSSTDTRKSVDSGGGSPAVSEAEGPATPARRRRSASSLPGHKPDTGKRSMKMPVLEED